MTNILTPHGEPVLAALRVSSAALAAGEQHNLALAMLRSATGREKLPLPEVLDRLLPLLVQTDLIAESEARTLSELFEVISSAKADLGLSEVVEIRRGLVGIGSSDTAVAIASVAAGTVALHNDEPEPNTGIWKALADLAGAVAGGVALGPAGVLVGAVTASHIVEVALDPTTP